MSYQEQNKGFQAPHQSYNAAAQMQADHLSSLQQQQSIPQIHMNNLNQQTATDWHHYYTQIGAAHSRQQMPSFIEHTQFPMAAYYPTATIQQRNAMMIPTEQPIVDGGGIFRSPQPQHQLYQQPASIQPTASSVSDLASLAQQHLIMTQQQYLQQQQQHYAVESQSQEHQMLNPHLFTNSIQQSLNNPSTSAAKILSAISQQSPQLAAQNPNQSNFQQQAKKKSDPMEPQKAQNILTKTPENAHLLAQKELEAIAELKAQEAVKKSQAVQDDLQRKQLDAEEHAQIVKEHIQSINEPIHLAGCHTLSKVSTFLPFPTEMAFTSVTLLPCFDQQQANLVLSNADLPLANYLGALLSDTTDHIHKIKLKHEEVELNNLEGISKLPALIQAIQITCKSAFEINDEFDLSERQNSTTNCEFGKQNYAGISPDEPNQTTNFFANPDFSAGMQMKKKNEAKFLYDSLSDYFSTHQQGRSRAAKCANNDDGDEEEDGVSTTTSVERAAENDDQSSELIGGDGNLTKKSRKRQREPSNETFDRATVDTPTLRKELLVNRPPTPTNVIQQRELEWNERQKQREEKYRRRQQQVSTNTTKLETWNVDSISEQESLCRFQALVDQILEQAQEAKNLMPSTINEESGFLLECTFLEELRIEAQKLKCWKKLWNIPVEKLVKLLGIMEKNIRDILTEDDGLAVHAKMKTLNEDESDEALRELIDDRLLRSVDAALVAMCIMTSKRVPKQVLMEDVIELSIKLCKNYMQDVICVADSSSLQAKSSRKSGVDTTLTAKRQKNYNTTLYMRLVDLMSYFSELVRFHNFNDILLFQLSSIGTPPFFIENVPEMQMQAIKLLPIIFAKCPNIRKTLLCDLLNSLHKLPSQRNSRNTYRLNVTESISNFTVLILQLIQSIVQLPSKKTSSHHHFRGDRDSKTALVDDLDDRFVIDLFEEAKKIAAYFLGGFLAKCTAKAEDDYRRLFEQFLQDILVALYRPLWPVAELIIMVLGNLLVVHYRTKTYDLSLRVASLDYLGIIAARLRKDRVHVLSEDATAQDKARLNSIVKSLLFDEYSYDPSYNNVDEIDISHISSSEKVRKLEQALFDYIIGTMWDGDLSVEYILLFYAVEWYRETVLDVEVVKERYTKGIAKGEISNKEKQKIEQKMLRIADKGQEMKLFIIGLMDKQHLKRRMQMISKNGNIIVENDANWVVKYLASKKELSQSFDIYLRKILEGFNPEIYPVAIRAKAMKCLAQIIEADYQVLMIPEVNKIVQERLIDANASVREATFDLIGKCLVSKPELLDTYYSILINRTKDTAVAVRKRVIRILREIVFLDARNQNLERNSQILSGILQRINDEEGVKKLCLETFQQLWMQPTYDKAKLEAKICLLVETAKCSITDGALEHFDTLISTLLQNTQEHGTSVAAKQLVDALVEHILFIEKNAVEEQKNNSSNKKQLIDSTVNYQARLFATLTSLSIIAKARPELLIRHIEVFLPYLSALSSSTMESNMVNQIIIMLEQIITLMAIHDTSHELIKQIETKLNEIVKDGGMLLIASAISCMSAIYEKFNQGEQPGICRLFIVYYKYIEKCKRENEYERQQTTTTAENNTAASERKPNLLRALYSMGLMCRYFDFDALLTKKQLALLQMDEQNGGTRQNGANEENETKENEKQIGIVKLSAFSLLFYFSRSPDYQISQKALIALGQLTAGFPIFLRREELKNMYMVLLSSDNCSYLQLKVQVLKNIACFLYTEEQKALKRAKQTKLEKQQQKQQQDDGSTSMFVDSSDEQSQPAIMDVDDLKEMELGSSGLSSSIIQQYWNAILKCYFHNDENVRMNSAQVIKQTLEQGLVTPGSSIPTLIAMSTDSSGTIRIRVDVLIRDMNTKYKGLLLSKAIPGVRLAFQLQKKLRYHSGQTTIRGIRANENPLNPIKAQENKSLPSMSADIQSLLGNFYVNIRKNRQSRRNFLISLLKFFSEENKEKIEREECLFIADNLAHFPYTVMDEPLYVIYHTNSIISISGQNILSQFRQLLIRPSVNGSQFQHFNNSPIKIGGDSSMTRESMLLNVSAASDEQEEEFSIQYIIDHLPPDRSMIYELKRNSQACFILLHLKTFLMRLYGLKEDKIMEYSPSEAANVYEKPINRRNIPTYSNEVFDEFLNEQGQGRTDVAEEKRKIAEDFHKFHEMLLSLDERRDDDDAEASSICCDASQQNQTIIVEEGDSNTAAAEFIDK